MEREDRIEAMGRECGATTAMQGTKPAEYQTEALPGKDAWKYLQTEIGDVTEREREIFTQGFCDQYYEMMDFEKSERGWMIKSKARGFSSALLFLLAIVGCGDTNIRKVDGSEITKQDIYRVVYRECVAFCDVFVPKLAKDCGLSDFRTVEQCEDCLWDEGVTNDSCLGTLRARELSGPFTAEECAKAKEKYYVDWAPYKGITTWTAPYYPAQVKCKKQLWTPQVG